MKADPPIAGAGVPRLTRTLGRLRALLRRAFLADGVASIGILLAVGIATSFALDYFLHLPRGVRGVLLFASIAIAGAAVWRRLLKPGTLSLPDEDLAVLLERAHPELEGRLLTAVELSQPGRETAAHVSPVLIHRVVEEAESRVGSLQLGRVFDLRRLRAKGIVAAVGVVALITFFAANASLASTWLSRNVLLSSSLWPRRVELAFEPALSSPVVVAVGDDLQVAVRVLKGSPEMLVSRALSGSGMERVDSLTESTSGIYRKTFTNVAQPFSFSVEGGDHRIGPVAVEVRVRPRIDMQSVRLWCEYPDYLGIASTPLEEPIRFGNLKVPVATRVRFEMATNVPVAAAYLVLDLRSEGDTGAAAEGDDRRSPSESEWPSAGAIPVDVRDERNLAGEFTVTGSGHYYLQLETAERFRNARPGRFRVQAIPDRAPLVKVIRPERLTEEVTPVATLSIRVDATDDYGVRAAAVEGSYFPPESDEGSPRTLAVPPVEGSEDRAENDASAGRRWSGALAVDVRTLADETLPPPAPGARFQFFVTAVDHGENSGESPVYYVRVVEPDELMQALNNRLMVVRDRLEELRRQQMSARRDLTTFQDEAALAGGVTRKSAKKLVRYERDAGRIRRGLDAETESIGQVLERAIDNRVGDSKWRNWVRGIQNEMAGLSARDAAAIVEQLQSLKARVEAADADASSLQAITDRQRAIENALDLLVMRLTEFNDLNALVRQLRAIQRRQTEIRDQTKALYDEDQER